MKVDVISVDVSGLVSAYPPKLKSKQKKVLYDACAPAAHSGRMIVTRWQQMALPAGVPSKKTKISAKMQTFDYEPSSKARTVWYLNFADKRLFMGYGGWLLAQDEVQVAMHPALASLREALMKNKAMPPLTMDKGKATPILIRGVPRVCRISTAGIYGYRFEKASSARIRAAVKRLRPKPSNIIAMGALVEGRGVYTPAQIKYTLQTAYTAFCAAKKESGRSKTVIHTGGWGTGANGGNKVLMPLLQLLAAHMAGVDSLVYHSVDKAGESAFREAAKLSAELAKLKDTKKILAAIAAMKLQWGRGTGD